MNLDFFEDIIKDTLNELPKEFSGRIENVAISVSQWPTSTDYQTAHISPGSFLFGLYKGIPRTKRGDFYSAVLPDKITIFVGPLMMVSHSLEDLKERVKKTVLHELGHYFGLSDRQIYAAQGF